MMPQVTVGVYRRLDDRQEGLPPNSPRALELHNRRKDALHSIFDAQSQIMVKDWGATDDDKPHEYVELVIAALAPVVLQNVVLPGLVLLGQKLLEKSVDTATGELAKLIISKIMPKQKEKRILDVIIKLPDSSFIRVDPPINGTSITISFGDNEIKISEAEQSTPNDIDA